MRVFQLAGVGQACLCLSAIRHENSKLKIPGFRSAQHRRASRCDASPRRRIGRGVLWRLWWFAFVAIPGPWLFHRELPRGEGCAACSAEKPLGLCLERRGPVREVRQLSSPQKPFRELSKYLQLRPTMRSAGTQLNLLCSIAVFGVVACCQLVYSIHEHGLSVPLGFSSIMRAYHRNGRR